MRYSTLFAVEILGLLLRDTSRKMEAEKKKKKKNPECRIQEN